MSTQNATYSSYRRMHSFKVIVGVALNAVITYVGKLYPGSISDRAIVQESGLHNHLTSGDLVLADKGFLINDMVSRGVSERRKLELHVFAFFLPADFKTN